MDLSDRLYQGFQKQYATEAGNYLVFQNIANIAGNLSWQGFEKFFQEYALDEITHAQKIADFIIGRNRTPFVDTLPNPGIKVSNDPIDWFKQSLAKSQNYTAIIKELYRQCEAEKDESAQVFLHWYLAEQDRVERVFTDFINELERIGSNAGILIINERLLK